MRALSPVPFLVALVTALGIASAGLAQPPRQVPAATAQRLQNIMIPLIRHMDHPIPLDKVHVKIMADDTINAANGGGGDFYVTTGLLQKANDDQIRAIMAHEIAHADLGHVAHQEKINTGIGIGLALLDKVWPQASNIAPIAGQFVANAYSRTDESQADAHGVQILDRAGYDGKDLMVNALTWLSRTEGNSGGFFTNHPLTSDRIAAIERLH
jgi:putative metalloprotease